MHPPSCRLRIEWVGRNIMRFVVVTALAGMLLAPLASAQKLELKFEAIAAKASDKAEVDLDGALLKLALPQVLSKKDKDGKSPVGDWLSGVQEIHVRHYEFAKAGSYSDQDLEPLRRQVSEGSGWSRVVNVKEKDESAEVFVQSQGGKVGSCLILATEAKELSVVYLMGTLTLAQMKELVDSNIAYNLTALAGEPSK
jgi:Domain of unknown function (DUF4252)